jgi:hypothetical protein
MSLDFRKNTYRPKRQDSRFRWVSVLTASDCPLFAYSGAPEFTPTHVSVGVRVAQSLVFCVVFCTSLFVFLYVFLWSSYWLSSFNLTASDCPLFAYSGAPEFTPTHVSVGTFVVYLMILCSNTRSTLTVLECYRNFNCVAIQVSLEYQYTKCISRSTWSNWLPRHLLIYHSTRLKSYVIHGIGKIKLLCSCLV